MKNGVTILAALLLAAPLDLVAAPPPVPASSTQLITVRTASWDAPVGQLQAYQRTEAGWQAQGEPFPVALGRKGSAWGLGLHPDQEHGPRKKEGDGRSPAGIFAIGTAFGYADRIASAMPYQAMRATSYCMDVPGSPLYNRIVDATVVGPDAVQGSTEPMRLDLHNGGDSRYREGFVIEHNPEAIAGQGSCIFAHLRRQPGEATAGCTAMEPEQMSALLAWLKPEAKPLFILLTEEDYARLQPGWGLPPGTP